jgi:hypothetical protein
LNPENLESAQILPVAKSEVKAMQKSPYVKYQKSGSNKSSKLLGEDQRNYENAHQVNVKKSLVKKARNE